MFVVLAVTTQTGGDFNDANSTGSSDNNRQIPIANSKFMWVDLVANRMDFLIIAFIVFFASKQGD
jgi:large-conductance mechanosensitive channel